MFIHDFRDAGEISGITGDIAGNIYFWFTVVMTSAMCLIPYFIYRRADYHFSDNIINNLRQRKYEQDYEKKKYKQKLEQMTKARRSILKFKRLYKDDNADPDNFADKRMKEIVDFYRSKKSHKGEAVELKFHKSKSIKSIKRELELPVYNEVPEIDLRANNVLIEEDHNLNRNMNEFNTFTQRGTTEVMNNFSNITPVENRLAVQHVVSESPNLSYASENKEGIDVTNLKMNPSKFNNI